jgi:hypothetical protein
LLQDQQCYEIRVLEGVAERTGVAVDRSVVRRSRGFCRSLNELTRKARQMGDGTFYLASLVWPKNKTELVLRDTWVGIH